MTTQALIPAPPTKPHPFMRHPACGRLAHSFAVDPRVPVAESHRPEYPCRYCGNDRAAHALTVEDYAGTQETLADFLSQCDPATSGILLSGREEICRSCGIEIRQYDEGLPDELITPEERERRETAATQGLRIGIADHDIQAVVQQVLAALSKRDVSPTPTRVVKSEPDPDDSIVRDASKHHQDEKHKKK